MSAERALQVLYEDYSHSHLRTVDEAQPVEQAEFRQGFSCANHIQTVSRIIEACREYRLPLVLAFVYYEKGLISKCVLFYF
ncbi:unnamed protein product [Strongylus vulgaris]|uniref:Uncharacterized protein n=1 Tax=Strongylus vulgaris TaxID=40348 RepID=A0A3P7K2V2_STRVU|nr:unnamed protein product [Strongylus vulgaris]